MDNELLILRIQEKIYITNKSNTIIKNVIVFCVLLVITYFYYDKRKIYMNKL